MENENIYELLKQGEILEVQAELEKCRPWDEKQEILALLISVFYEEVENNVEFSVFEYSVDIDELVKRHNEIKERLQQFILNQENMQLQSYIANNNISQEYVNAIEAKIDTIGKKQPSQVEVTENRRAIYEIFTGKNSLLNMPYAPLYIETDTDYLCFTTRNDVNSSYWKVIVLENTEDDTIQHYLEKYEQRMCISEDYILFGPIFDNVGSDNPFVMSVPPLDMIPAVTLDVSDIVRTYDDNGNYIFQKNPVYRYGKYDGREKLLTIGVPVSNQIATIEDCLKGIKPLLDELDAELLVIDTGSSDGTVEVCRKYGARVIEYPWCDNMSVVRNLGINYALGEWYMSIDDDEVFENVEDILVFFKTGNYKNFERAMYIQRNYVASTGGQYVDKYVLRMGKITSELHFEGRIHDAMYPVSRKTFAALEAVAEHYGFAKDNVDKTKKKYIRNTGILLKDVYEAPDNFRYTFQLANEMENVGIFDYAAAYFLKGLSMEREENDTHWGRCNAVSFISSLHENKDNRMHYVAEKFMERYDFTYAETAYIYYCMANLGRELGKEKNEVMGYCKEYFRWLEIYKNDPLQSDANTFMGLHVCTDYRYADRIKEIMEECMI